MLKLAEILAREEGAIAAIDMAEREKCIPIAAQGHPGLTVEAFLIGERDRHGHILATGYTGWFIFFGKGSLPSCVARVCLELGCSPSTLLADVLEVMA